MTRRHAATVAAVVVITLFTVGLQIGLPWGCQRFVGTTNGTRWKDTFSFSALRNAGPSNFFGSSKPAPPAWIDFSEACVVPNKLVFRDSQQKLQSLDLKTGRFEDLFTAAGLAVFGDENSPAYGQCELREIQQKPQEFVARFALDRLRANFPFWKDNENSMSHDLDDVADRIFAAESNGHHLRFSRHTGRLTVERYDAGKWKPAG